MTSSVQTLEVNRKDKISPVSFLDVDKSLTYTDIMNSC